MSSKRIRMNRLHSLSRVAKKLRPIFFASFAFFGGQARAAIVVKPKTSVNAAVDLSPLLESFEPLPLPLA